MVPARTVAQETPASYASAKVPVDAPPTQLRQPTMTEIEVVDVGLANVTLAAADVNPEGPVEADSGIPCLGLAMLASGQEVYWASFGEASLGQTYSPRGETPGNRYQSGWVLYPGTTSICASETPCSCLHGFPTAFVDGDPSDLT
jgi:hypothetical protein